MEWLGHNMWLGWLGLALVLLAIEAATVDFVFVMFAGGALAGAAAAGAGQGFTIQVLVAVAVAVLLLGLVRPTVRRRFLDSEVDHGIGAAGLVGREALVLEPVTAHSGLVKLGGEEWTARTADGSPDAPAGTAVLVVAINGAIAVVSPSIDVGPVGIDPGAPVSP